MGPDPNSSAAILVELTVAENGKILACQSSTIMGDKSLGSVVCGIIKRRKMAPATFRDGKVAFSRFRSLLRLSIPGGPLSEKVATAEQPADLVIDVKALPGGVNSRFASLVVAHDATGKVVDCEQLPSRRPEEVQFSGACATVGGYSAEPLKLSDGSAVPFVSKLKVEFHIKP